MTPQRISMGSQIALNCSLHEYAALLISRFEFARIRRIRSAAAQTINQEPFAIRRGAEPLRTASLHAFLFTSATSKAASPAKVKAIAFLDTRLLQRATCSLAYHARTAPRTINPGDRNWALSKCNDA
jgi:hypothetical protein